MKMRTHVKILGYIYSALACLVALCSIMILIVHAFKGELLQAGGVVFILLILASWWFWVGSGLLHYRRGIRPYVLIIAVILMISLNGLLLLFGGEPFSTGTGWIAFHLSCILIGIYTVVIILLPGTKDILK